MWAYQVTPNIGDRVFYVNDGFSSKVDAVRWDRIIMSDSSHYTRHGNWRRIWTWIAEHSSKRVRHSSEENTPRTSRPLRPTTPFVQYVNLNV